MEFRNLVLKLKDDTMVYRNPFAGTESWTIPERKFRPFHTNRASVPHKLHVHSPEDYCTFCPANYLDTTPEKTRIVLRDGFWELVESPDPDDIFSQTAEFRRIGNLYEIISTNYWITISTYAYNYISIVRKHPNSSNLKISGWM